MVQCSSAPVLAMLAASATAAQQATPAAAALASDYQPRSKDASM